MPFNNPIVAGEELIRNSIRSENFVSAEDSEEGDGSGWSVNRDGTAEFSDILVRGNVEGDNGAFNNVSANSTFTYKGEELQTILDALPRGLQAFGYLGGGTYTVSGGVFRYLIELDIATVPGRAYRCYSTHNRATSTTTTESVRYIIAWTDNGSQPVIGAGGTSVGAVSQFTTPITNRTDSLQIEYVHYADATRLRVALAFDAEFGNPVQLQFDEIKFFIEDVGPVKSDTGINRYSGGGGAAVFKSFQISSYGSRSYRGNGSLYTPSSGDIQQYCMGGDAGVDGNRRSWIWFDANLNTGGNGLGSINDMQGADSFDYFDVYLYYPHWYFGSGGTAFIGHHNSNVITNTEQGGGVYGEKTEGWPGRNIGKWVSLLGTGIASAALAGTIEGITLGNTGNATLNHYGYAFGFNNGSGFAPQLRAGYYK